MRASIMQNYYSNYANIRLNLLWLLAADHCVGRREVGRKRIGTQSRVTRGDGPRWDGSSYTVCLASLSRLKYAEV